MEERQREAHNSNYSSLSPPALLTPGQIKQKSFESELLYDFSFLYPGQTRLVFTHGLA